MGNDIVTVLWKVPGQSPLPYPVYVGGINLIRGVPGSGKSTLAQEFQNALNENCPEHPGVILEADQWFMKNGEYCFDPRFLPEAHNDCRKRTSDAIIQGCTAIVANTFVRVTHLIHYQRLAQQLAVPIVIHEVLTPWRQDAAECAKRNTHGVGEAAIQRMLHEWESAHIFVWDYRRDVIKPISLK